MTELQATHEEFYTVGEVADLLKVSKSTVYRLLDRGELVGFRTGLVAPDHSGRGARWRIRAREVQQFITNQFGKE